MPRTGRPQKAIDWKLFDKLSFIQCTQVEIASVLELSVDTLERRVKSKFKMTYAEYYKKRSAGGKMSLRRAQWTKAIGTTKNVKNEQTGEIETIQNNDGNVTMQIWLGKQYLNQSESPVGESDELCEGFDLDEI